MTDSTDNARGPERIFAEMEPYDFSGFSPCWVWHHPESIEDGTDGAIEYVRADLAPDPLGAVNVKPLAWRDTDEREYGHAMIADGMGVTYEAGVDAEGQAYWKHHKRVDWSGVDISGWISDAINAAQADHETRIRSALEPCDQLADPRVVALVEALEQIAGEAQVPVKTWKNGINFKKMYEGWRKIATTRIDIARAALAALSPTGGNTDG